MPSAFSMKNYYKPNESVVDLGGGGAGGAPQALVNRGAWGGGGQK